jgi:hypothetical protein
VWTLLCFGFEPPFLEHLASIGVVRTKLIVVTRAGKGNGGDESTIQRAVESCELMDRGPALVTWIASTLRLIALRPHDLDEGENSEEDPKSRVVHSGWAFERGSSREGEARKMAFQEYFSVRFIVLAAVFIRGRSSFPKLHPKEDGCNINWTFHPTQLDSMHAWSPRLIRNNLPWQSFYPPICCVLHTILACRLVAW